MHTPAAKSEDTIDFEMLWTTTGQRQSTFEVWHRRAQMRAAGKCIRAASLVPWAMASRNLHNK